jgi:hypothetical protein
LAHPQFFDVRMIFAVCLDENEAQEKAKLDLSERKVEI